MKRLSIPVLILMWLALAALACNLNSQPPTLVPRATATPPPTIGYATLSPQELPDQATVAPQFDASMVNLINQVQPDRLMAHINALQSFGTRHVNSAYNLPNSGIGAAQTYIRQQFEGIAGQSQGRFSLISHSFPVTWGGVNSNAENVVGYLSGRETNTGVIIIGAHYDSVSANWEDGAAYAPGANDNASGVAALLEIARVMAARPQAPRAPVLFVAFSAEEIGRVGSKAFVRDYVQQYNLPVLAMINMDIIGSQTGPDGSINDREIRLYSQGNDAPEQGIFDTESPSRKLARQIHIINSILMPTMQINLQLSGDREGRYSDHLSFSEVGYPAVRFIEPLEESFRQHSDRDTTEDIQINYLTRSAQTILVTTAAMADGPRPPRNVVIRVNSDSSRTLVWEPVGDAMSYVVALRYPGSAVYNQFFETSDTSVIAQIFTPDRLSGVAVAARDSTGLIGPFSFEFAIVN